MLYLRLCLDRPESGDLRADKRADHRNYLGAHADLIRQAGPLLGEDGQMIGSMMIVEAEEIGAVRNFHEADPFTLAGLFETVHIFQWDRHMAS
ncbi:YCII-related protein [Novosphingobium resinovorum]|uniref:YCII-related protein n=1 Tax=Novosphingobium resinovorum TaxID=158500 RepID=A0A031K438_9SPHN|nr:MULTISPECIES: YciI family protein [Novosphingobium]EZP83979.1 YCII-related protein [Novosphingobium resinovorum]